MKCYLSIILFFLTITGCKNISNDSLVKISSKDEINLENDSTAKEIKVAIKQKIKINDEDLKLATKFIYEKLITDDRYKDKIPYFGIEDIDIVTTDNKNYKFGVCFSAGTQSSLTCFDFLISNHQIISEENCSYEFLRKYPPVHTVLFDVNRFDQKNNKNTQFEEEIIKNKIENLAGKEYCNYIQNGEFQECYIVDDYYIELVSKIYSEWEKELLLIIDIKNKKMQIFVVNEKGVGFFSEQSETFPINKTWLRSHESIKKIINSKSIKKT